MLMAELATAAKYDLNVKIVVLKNNSLGQIKWEQMAFLGNPEYRCDPNRLIMPAWRRPAAFGAIRLSIPINAPAS